MKKLLSAFIAGLLLLLVFSSYAVGMMADKNFEQWEKHDKTSTLVIDHAQFQDFIDRYVYRDPSGVNMVRYSAVTQEDKDKLKAYLTYLSKLPIAKYNQNEQLAYWTNLYNALTVQLILAYYPVKSIREINLNPNWIMRFVHPGPWEAPAIVIQETKLSLNDIEHRIVRPIWKNPLIHYGFNCAAYSCPNLQLTVFMGNNVYKQLEAGARSYINNARGVKIENNALIVSSIYEWYQSDFGDTEASVLLHLEKYAAPALRKQLGYFMMINKYEYDWTLNGN